VGRLRILEYCSAADLILTLSLLEFQRRGARATQIPLPGRKGIQGMVQLLRSGHIFNPGLTKTNLATLPVTLTTQASGFGLTIAVT